MVVDPDVETYSEFTDLLQEKGFIDKDYPESGAYIWKPRGYKFKENVFNHIENEIEEHDYEPHQFPSLVPGELIRPVTEELYDFEDGMFWLRENNGEEIDTFLYPTGEAPVYNMMDEWINFESDLPLKLFQRNSLLRPAEQPKTLINNSEFMDQFEAHAALTSSEKAEREFEDMIGYLEKMHEDLGIPFLPLERPLQGNMPVYDRMVSFETFLPSKQRSFNIGMLYDQGQNFSDVYDVDFSRQDGSKENTQNVTFGISERAIAGMLDLHRDEKGLRMLPEFAPDQVQIIPVYDGEHNSAIRSFSQEIYSKLNSEYRVNLDIEDSAPGKKIARGQQRGVPVQIGIGYQNLEERTGRVFLRTQTDSPLTSINEDQILRDMPSYLKQVRSEIVDDAEKELRDAVEEASAKSEVESIVDDGGIAEMYWCGSDDCLEELNSELTGELIGTALEDDEEEIGECLECENETEKPSYFAKRVTTA